MFVFIPVTSYAAHYRIKDVLMMLWVIDDVTLCYIGYNFTGLTNFVKFWSICIFMLCVYIYGHVFV